MFFFPQRKLDDIWADRWLDPALEADVRMRLLHSAFLILNPRDADRQMKKTTCPFVSWPCAPWPPCETGDRSVRLMHFAPKAMGEKIILLIFCYNYCWTSRIEPVYSSSLFSFKQWRKKALVHVCFADRTNGRPHVFRRLWLYCFFGYLRKSKSATKRNETRGGLVLLFLSKDPTPKKKRNCCCIVVI